MVNAVDGWGAGVIVYALRYEHYSCAKQLLALKEVTLGSSKKKKSVFQIAMAAYIKVKAQQNLLLLIGDMGAKHNKDSSTLTNDNSRGPALPSFSALSLINSASGRKENKQKQQEQEEQKNKTVEEHGAKLSQNGHGKKEATQEEMPPVIRVGVGEASISSREDEVAMCLDLVLTAFCLEVGMPCRRAVDSADACNTPLHERKALSPTKMAKALPLICTCSHQEIRAKLLHMIGCEQVLLWLTGTSSSARSMERKKRSEVLKTVCNHLRATGANVVAGKAEPCVCRPELPVANFERLCDDLIAGCSARAIRLVGGCLCAELIKPQFGISQVLTCVCRTLCKAARLLLFGHCADRHSTLPGESFSVLSEFLLRFYLRSRQHQPEGGTSSHTILSALRPAYLLFFQALTDVGEHLSRETAVRFSCMFPSLFGLCQVFPDWDPLSAEEAIVTPTPLPAVKRVIVELTGTSGACGGSTSQSLPDRSECSEPKQKPLHSLEWHLRTASLSEHFKKIFAVGEPSRESARRLALSVSMAKFFPFISRMEDAVEVALQVKLAASLAFVEAKRLKRTSDHTVVDSSSLAQPQTTDAEQEFRDFKQGISRILLDGAFSDEVESESSDVGEDEAVEAHQTRSTHAVNEPKQTPEARAIGNPATTQASFRSSWLFSGSAADAVEIENQFLECFFQPPATKNSAGSAATSPVPPFTQEQKRKLGLRRDSHDSLDCLCGVCGCDDGARSGSSSETGSSDSGAGFGVTSSTRRRRRRRRRARRESRSSGTFSANSSSSSGSSGGGGGCGSDSLSSSSPSSSSGSESSAWNSSSDSESSYCSEAEIVVLRNTQTPSKADAGPAGSTGLDFASPGNPLTLQGNPQIMSEAEQKQTNAEAHSQGVSITCAQGHSMQFHYTAPSYEYSGMAYGCDACGREPLAVAVGFWHCHSCGDFDRCPHCTSVPPTQGTWPYCFESSAEHSPDRLSLLSLESLSLVCLQVQSFHPHQLLHSFCARFAGEEGIGEGPTREFFNLITRSLLHPTDSPFFTLAPSGRYTVRPVDPAGMSRAQKEQHLSFYEMAGRVWALALVKGVCPGAQLSPALVNRMAGRRMRWPDHLKGYDDQLHGTLQRLFGDRYGSATGEASAAKVVELRAAELTFVVSRPGGWEEELVPNGAHKAVTEENADQFLDLYCNAIVFPRRDQICRTAVCDGETSAASSCLPTSRGCLTQAAVRKLRKGFTSILPPLCSRHIRTAALVELLKGPSKIDVKAMRKHIFYNSPLHSRHKIVKWFWAAVSCMDERQQSLLLMFWSGSAFPPLHGFNPSMESDGDQWSLELIRHGNPEDLPNSSTCSYQLRLPSYLSYNKLRSKLLKALELACQGFAET